MAWAEERGKEAEEGEQDVGGGPPLPLDPVQPLAKQGKKEEEEEEATSGLSEVPSRESRPRDTSRGARHWGGREAGGLAWAPVNVGQERESGWDSGEANKQSSRDNNNKEKSH